MKAKYNQFKHYMFFSRKNMRTIALGAFALGALSLSGCENESDRNIYAAQDCLDHASNAAEADVCTAKINGDESPQAYLIRCSAHFVAEEFTGARIAAAFQSLKDDNNSGQNPTMIMMSHFVFTKNAPGHTAAETLDDCKKSGLSSMIQIATAANTATQLATLGGGTAPTGTFDPAQMEAALENLRTATDADKETVGNLAINMQDSFCKGDTSFKDNDVCKTLNAALASGNNDPKAIGEQLIEELLSSN